MLPRIGRSSGHDPGCPADDLAVELATLADADLKASAIIGTDVPSAGAGIALLEVGPVELIYPRLDQVCPVAGSRFDVGTFMDVDSIPEAIAAYPGHFEKPKEEQDQVGVTRFLHSA